MHHSYILFNIIFTACIVFVFAISAKYVFVNFFNAELGAEHRFDTLDGLRGLAAILVAIHHSFFFYWYAKTGEWSIHYLGGHLRTLVDYLGKGSVSVFFMITAFLFWGKILCRTDEINWRHFYIKRFFRIVPLYVVVVFSVFLYVIITNKSKFELFSYVRDLFYWLTFNFFGTPDINGFPFSKGIVSGVFWTLSYEWMFYFLLPVLSVFANNKKSSAFILCAMLSICAFMLYFNVEINVWAQIHVMCFVIGAACAHLYKFNNLFTTKLNSPVFSVIAMISVIICLIKFDAPYSHSPTILIGIAFLIISSGNTIFGIFKSKVMRVAGAISFSVYLIHGITYTVLFSPLIKAGVSFYISMVITVPVILALSTASYLIIERRFIAKGNLVVKG